MATLAAKKAFTLAPTVRTLASGVPLAPSLNLAAKPLADGHGHGASRADKPSAWASSTTLSSAGLISRTAFTGAWMDAGAAGGVSNPFTSSSNWSLPATPALYLRCRKGCTPGARLLTLPCPQHRQEPHVLVLHGRLPWCSLRVDGQVQRV